MILKFPDGRREDGVVYLKEGKFYSVRDSVAPVFEPELDSDAAYIEFQIDRFYSGERTGQATLRTVAQDNNSDITAAAFLEADKVVLTGGGFLYFINNRIGQLTAEVTVGVGTYDGGLLPWVGATILGGKPESMTQMTLVVPNFDINSNPPIPVKNMYWCFRLKLGEIVFYTKLPEVDEIGKFTSGILMREYPKITAAALEIGGGSVIATAGGEGMVLTGTGFIRGLPGSVVELRDESYLNAVEVAVRGYTDTQIYITTPATAAGLKQVCITRGGITIGSTYPALIESA